MYDGCIYVSEYGPGATVDKTKCVRYHTMKKSHWLSSLIGVVWMGKYC